MNLSRFDEMEADEIHRAGRADRLAWLRERERAADELFEKLVELRLRFHLQFGAGSSEELFGIEDDVPIEPPTLHQVAEQAYDSLVYPGLELPVQRLADLLVHPLQLAAGLESPMRDLGEALDALGPEPQDSATGAGDTSAATRSIDFTFPTQRRSP